MLIQLDGLTSIVVKEPEKALDCSKCCELGEGEKQCTQDKCHEWGEGEIVLFQKGDLGENVIIIRYTPSTYRQEDFSIRVEQPEG